MNTINGIDLMLITLLVLSVGWNIVQATNIKCNKHKTCDSCHYSILSNNDNMCNCWMEYCLLEQKNEEKEIRRISDDNN